MRLADDDVQIKLGPQTVSLRPTLRAAFRLEQKYDGFHNLIRAVAGGNLSAISDVIKEGCGQATALTDFLDTTDDLPLAISLDLLISPICAFILSLGGIETAIQIVAREPIAFVDYHTKLFRIATGWLGWTPDQAWNATPAEILEAQQGRAEMLASIFGGGNKPDDETLGTNAKDHLNALGDLTVTSMSQVPPCQ